MRWIILLLFIITGVLLGQDITITHICQPPEWDKTANNIGRLEVFRHHSYDGRHYLDVQGSNTRGQPRVFRFVGGTSDELSNTVAKVFFTYVKSKGI
jgi:hypothetical protein